MLCPIQVICHRKQAVQSSALGAQDVAAMVPAAAAPCQTLSAPIVAEDWTVQPWQEQAVHDAVGVERLAAFFHQGQP